MLATQEEGEPAAQLLTTVAVVESVVVAGAVVFDSTLPSLLPPLVLFVLIRDFRLLIIIIN